jgi:CHASE1-domain containing sensor protein
VNVLPAIVIAFATLLGAATAALSGVLAPVLVALITAGPAYIALRVSSHEQRTSLDRLADDLTEVRSSVRRLDREYDALPCLRPVYHSADDCPDEHTP